MGLIDTEGKEIIPCLYDSVNIKSEGLVVIKKAGELKSIPISVLLQNGVDWENMNPYS